MLATTNCYNLGGLSAPRFSSSGCVRHSSRHHLVLCAGRYVNSRRATQVGTVTAYPSQTAGETGTRLQCPLASCPSYPEPGQSRPITPPIFRRRRWRTLISRRPFRTTNTKDVLMARIQYTSPESSRIRRSRRATAAVAANSTGSEKAGCEPFTSAVFCPRRLPPDPRRARRARGHRRTGGG